MNNIKKSKAFPIKLLVLLLLVSLLISGCNQSNNENDEKIVDSNEKEPVDDSEDDENDDLIDDEINEDDEDVDKDIEQEDDEIDDQGQGQGIDDNDGEDEDEDLIDDDSEDTPIITANPGTTLLGEAFNVDERLDITLSGAGTLTYFVNDIQVFGGLYEDGDQVHIIVGDNSKLVLTDTLTGEIVVNNDLEIDNLLPGMYEADVDFPFGTYLVSIDFAYPPSSVTILSNLDELEIIDMTLVDDESGNNIQYSIDKNQIIVFENANSISLSK